MIKININKSLVKEIKKKFPKSEIKKILKLFYSLEESPSKGKTLTVIGSVLIKELKFTSFRFYYLIDSNYKIILLSKEKLEELIIKIVAMSKKNNQQKIIDKLKLDLKHVFK